MPKTIEVTVYEFDELSEDAKSNARFWWLEGAELERDAFDTTKEDAAQIGLDLKEVRFATIEGEFTVSATECADLILANHGTECETFKIAAKFDAALDALPELDRDENDQVILNDNERKLCESVDALEGEFLSELLLAYSAMYDKEVADSGTDERVREAINANEYTFTADGKRFG